MYLGCPRPSSQPVKSPARSQKLPPCTEAQKKGSNLQPGVRPNIQGAFGAQVVSRAGFSFPGRCCHCLLPDWSPGSFSAHRLRDGAAAAASFRPQWPAVRSLSPLIRLHSTSIWRVVDRAAQSSTTRNRIDTGSGRSSAFQIKVPRARRGRVFYFEAVGGSGPWRMTSLDARR